MSWAVDLDLRGGGGEPVSLPRTLLSHGLASLAPMTIDEDVPELEVTIALSRGRPRIARVREGRPGTARVTVLGPAPSARRAEEIVATVRRILRLEQDLSPFYELASDDPHLAWVLAGAGRMIRGQTVFEDLVKTICTTNCTWSATVRMTNGLVEQLGAPAALAPPHGPRGRAFPRAAAMASVDEAFYRDVVRAGYRGAYLRALAEMVAAGDLDVEAWGDATEADLPDEELERRLLALPGVGPYAAAHMMMMLGRYSRLILDSWTRPKFARVSGRRAKDATIVRRFRRYGRYAGLAFWLFLTRDWIPEPAGE